jgi:excinuclease ABC subunit A
LFSFNSPLGACETCDGLGEMEYFDESRVVAFPSLSLASGAVKGWDSRNSFYHSALQSLSKHYKINLDKAFEDLSAEAQKLVLYGSGTEEIKFQYVFESGGLAGQTYTKKQPFEGIIPNMQRRYRETDSNIVREDLAKYRSHQPCTSCSGARLKREARHVFVVDSETKAQTGLQTISHLTLAQAHAFFSTLKLSGARAEIAAKVVQEIAARLKFLNDVGLNYLSLDRSAETLSGGESQRIRLASQIGSGLTGVMYVLDEPSIGLHQRDNDRLIGTLKHLRDIGNSVLVVEHDEDMIRAADHVIDMGPGAGVHGGRVMAEGTAQDVASNAASLTGQYLSGVQSIAVPAKRRAPASDTTPLSARADISPTAQGQSKTKIPRYEVGGMSRSDRGVLRDIY